MPSHISSARGGQSNFAGFIKTRTGVFEISGSRVVAIFWAIFFNSRPAALWRFTFCRHWASSPERDGTIGYP